MKPILIYDTYSNRIGTAVWLKSKSKYLVSFVEDYAHDSVYVSDIDTYLEDKGLLRDLDVVENEKGADVNE